MTTLALAYTPLEEALRDDVLMAHLEHGCHCGRKLGLHRCGPGYWSVSGGIPTFGGWFRACQARCCLSCQFYEDVWLGQRAKRESLTAWGWPGGQTFPFRQCWGCWLGVGAPRAGSSLYAASHTYAGVVMVTFRGSTGGQLRLWPGLLPARPIGFARWLEKPLPDLALGYAAW